MKKLSLLFFILVLTKENLAGVVLGAECQAACLGSCLSMSPFKFSGLVGVAIDYSGCFTMCLVVCANAIAIPGVCFSPQTKFQGTNGWKIASQVTVGDELLTHHKNKTIMAKVIVAQQMVGSFEFTSIRLTNTKTKNIVILSVTSGHGTIVQDSNQFVVKQASEVSIGDIMIGKFFEEYVVDQVDFSISNQKYLITTDLKTVFAQDIWLTTECFDGFDQSQIN